jgi:hypothetical protein
MKLPRISGAELLYQSDREAKRRTGTAPEEQNDRLPLKAGLSIID